LVRRGFGGNSKVIARRELSQNTSQCGSIDKKISLDKLNRITMRAGIARILVKATKVLKCRSSGAVTA
jgi:hypothetical protein